MTKAVDTEKTEHVCHGQCRAAAQEHAVQETAEQNPEHLAQIAELTETLQRLQAEFENYKKRTEKENAEFRKYANKQFIAELLPILDNFELALKSINDEGIKLLYAHLFDILEKQGLKRIDATGKFDPRFHEALLQEESEKESGIILEELQKGYIGGETVLRPARVKIAIKKIPSTPSA